jgi:hypothetical protein
VNKAEAREILRTELANYRGVAYAALAAMVDAPKRTTQIIGSSGVRYALDIVVSWDGQAGGAVRVIGTIDDAGWRAFAPMNDDFIKAPDGSFVGERA